MYHGLKFAPSGQCIEIPAKALCRRVPGCAPIRRSSGASHVDMWAAYDYIVPGIFLLGTKTYPVGTAAACGMQAPDPDEQRLTTTKSQAVTPIDEEHTIYYYSGCLPRRVAGEQDSRQQLALFERVFAEDNAMIEAQQRVMHTHCSRACSGSALTTRSTSPAG
jgi:vanillate O-demethylase monooxygenase subunit